MHWRRKWQPTPVFLSGESQGWGSLVGCRLWGCRVGHDWSDLAAAAAAYSITTWGIVKIFFSYFQLKSNPISLPMFWLVFSNISQLCRSGSSSLYTFMLLCCSNYQNSWKATISFFHNNCFCCWPLFFIYAVYFVMATHKILWGTDRICCFLGATMSE